MKSLKNLGKFKIPTIIVMLLGLLSFSAFGMFILEEALQAYGFGLYALQSAGAWEELVVQIEYYQTFHNGCDGIMKFLYILNPVAMVWFSKYMEADQAKIDLMRKGAQIKVESNKKWEKKTWQGKKGTYSK